MIEYEYNGRLRMIIPLAEMETGVYYAGDCRNATHAYWNGLRFIHLRTKWGDTFLEGIEHPENEQRYDVFLVDRPADHTDPDVVALKTAIDCMDPNTKEYYERITNN